MTGFARVEGGTGALSWAWEARSVNAKGLDIRLRLPSGFDRLETPVRALIQKTFKRGSISATLTVQTAPGGLSYQVNEAFLEELLGRLPALKERLPDAPPPTIEGVLGLRGVIEPSDGGGEDEDTGAALDAATADAGEVFGALARARAEEGAKLASVLEGQLARISALAAEASAQAALQPDAIRARLREQVARLMEDAGGLNEDRLAQEAALLMTKADVREELDRLVAHVASAGELLQKGGPVGRRLDFMCQELNRETNTLCSKSQDKDLTRVGLELKTIIEQFREQIQNIE